MNVTTLKSNYPDVYQAVFESGILHGLSAENPETLKAELFRKSIKAEVLGEKRKNMEEFTAFVCVHLALLSPENSSKYQA